MVTLPRVEGALRQAHAGLNSGVVDLAYLLDLEPDGSECIVVYVTIQKGAEPSHERKWEIEAALRSALSRVNDLPVYFRWRTDAERLAEERRVATKGGLFDLPHSALLARG